MLYNVYRQASVSIFCWCCLWFWLTLGFCRPDILNEFLTFWRRTVWPRIVGWSLNSDPWHRYQMKAYTPSKTPLTEMQTKAGFPNNEISFRAGVFTTLQFHFCEGSVFVLIEKDTFETFNHFEEFQDFGKNALYQASLYSTWVLTLLCLILAQSTQDPNSAVRTGFAPKNMSKTCHERIPSPEILNTPYNTSTAAQQPAFFLTPEKNAQKHVPCLVDNRPKFCTIIVPSWCNGRGLR